MAGRVAPRDDQHGVRLRQSGQIAKVRRLIKRRKADLVSFAECDDDSVLRKSRGQRVATLAEFGVGDLGGYVGRTGGESAKQNECSSHGGGLTSADPSSQVNPAANITRSP